MLFYQGLSFSDGKAVPTEQQPVDLKPADASSILFYQRWLYSNKTLAFQELGYSQEQMKERTLAQIWINNVNDRSDAIGQLQENPSHPGLHKVNNGQKIPLVQGDLWQVSLPLMLDFYTYLKFTYPQEPETNNMEQFIKEKLKDRNLINADLEPTEYQKWAYRLSADQNKPAPEWLTDLVPKLDKLSSKIPTLK